MNKLHPGARWSFRFGAYLTLLIPMIFLAGFLNSFLSIYRVATWSGAGSDIQPVFSFFSLFLYIIIVILFILVIGEVYARMAYNRWRFEFTDTNLKKEHGIIWKRYSNIPYERVQNVDIHRGILARMFGFSSVMIHTAGYSGHGGKYGGGAEGSIPAVSPEFAEKIRDFLMKKIGSRHEGGQGL